MSAIRQLPTHVGIIMDGNGRWANSRHMPRSYGHNAGMKTMGRLFKHAAKLGIKYITVYALSTENLKTRPQEELDQLFNLLRKYFGEKVGEIYKNGAAIRVIGDPSPLPGDIRQLIADGVKNSPQEPQYTITFAINYGSRAEIVRAAQRLKESGEEISEESFALSLDSAGIPDPDFIIRTGGEVRLSNFLLWQAAYAELYFTPVLFPDFNVKEFDKALSSFAGRNRRFGGLN